MTRLATIIPLALALLAPLRPAGAQPTFVNGLVIPGATLDATREPGANAGRLGFFSEPLPMIPEIGRRYLEPTRRPVMRVTGDAQGTLATNLPQDVLGRLIGADVLGQVQADDVGVVMGADVVLITCERRSNHESENTLQGNTPSTRPPGQRPVPDARGDAAIRRVCRAALAGCTSSRNPCGLRRPMSR